MVGRGNQGDHHQGQGARATARVRPYNTRSIVVGRKASMVGATRDRPGKSGTFLVHSGSLNIRKGGKER